ncbi:ABC transporter ATP-binding protein [Ruania alba]|uniref:ABC-type multidrug transport system, ATPase and permease component n=1 Tax=Ruania alba TaxID=648782 RepID=A0A1H5GMZ9_9MICO|nr:ABC transporter ATP-binding protein [Ruania alba]SEE16438.1 ABC-type multidrug transport system, ATPase and permease component [Ruania alba]
MPTVPSGPDTHPDPDSPHALSGSAVRRSLLLLGRGLKSQPRPFAIAIGASVGYGIAMVASGWALGQVTDRVVVPALTGPGISSSTLWAAGAILLVIAAATAVGVALRRTFAGVAALGVQAGHRRAVTRQYLRLPMTWHRKHPAGQLLSNANADAETAGFVFGPLPFALGVIAMIVVASGAMLAADPFLGAIGISMLPLILVANAVYRRRMAPAVTQVQHERAVVSDVAHESFEAAAVVKSLGTVEIEEERFTAAADRLRAANVGVGRIRSVFDPVIDLLPALATLLVLAVGSSRVAARAIETGDVITASYLLTVLAIPVRAIGFVLGDLPRSLVGHDRISRVIDARGYLSEGDRTLDDADGVHLAVEAVTLRAPDADSPDGQRTILNDVSFEVPAGRTLAIVGSTGAGKSTLVDLLARLRDPSEGVVRYDGVDLREIRSGNRTGTVALVAQQAFVFEDTVRDNVTLGDGTEDRPFSDEEVWKALRIACADSFVDALPDGLDTVIGERGASLSGGQRQRLAIARALIRRPRLLLLDDATSALDPVVEQAILTGLREIAGDVTVVVVAYRNATIALADTVLHLDRGQVTGTGSHAELLASDPGYRRLVTAYQRERDERAEVSG